LIKSNVSNSERENTEIYSTVSLYNLSSNVTIAQGAAALADFLLGGSTGSASAIKAADDALSADSAAEKIVGGLEAGGGVNSIGASSAAMFQRFATNSIEAGALATRVASGAVFLSLGTLVRLSTANGSW